MNNMSYGTEEFNQSLDQWNVSNVCNMALLFFAKLIR
ncbi:BspA family leucine-rich repeat surface protein [archaeon]|nr:MAG: BspA family leucine-rich repeat surface protein [archaeon]